MVVGPEGIDEPIVINSSTPAITPSQDPSLLKALGRGYYWQHLLDAKVAANASEIAEREGLHKVTVNEALRIALLAPCIVQTAFEGRLPRTTSLESLLRTTIPQDWGKQRDMIAGVGH